MESIDTQLLRKDKKLLEHTTLPIVTVAATFRHDLESYYHLPDRSPKDDEVLFSRAHYSMALAALIARWGGTIPNPKRAWIIDPTNYVSHKDWRKVEVTTLMGQAMARNHLLKWLKDQVDSRVRSKLPITGAITTPLLYACEHVHRPILSFHYEAGNILAAAGKQVVEVVTDPHVREQYLTYAELPTIRFCVFDQNTKTEMLEKAATIGKKLDPKRVIVTGPPVDPRIVKAAKHKQLYDGKRALRLVIATGGLGTNKAEMELCLRSIAPQIGKIHVVIYAGVHEDIRESMHAICHELGLPTANAGDATAPLRILYSPHVVEANELLVQYAFPWADGFVTKPSGDMAYEAAAAGCFLLTMEPWGEWEQNIRDVFEQHQVSRRAIPEKLSEQLSSLVESGWVKAAQENARHLPEIFTHGIQNILAQLPQR